jgi:hypothetical protein
MKKIKLSEDNISYKVEYIFNFHTSSVYKGIKLKTKNILSCGLNDYLILWVYNPKFKEEEIDDKNDNIEIYNNNSDMYKAIKFMEAGLDITDVIEMKNGNFVCASNILQFWTFFQDNLIEEPNDDINEIYNEIEFEKGDKEKKNGDKNNKIISDSTESQFSYKINQINNNNEDTNQKGREKIYINKNEYYEKKGSLELKTSSSNCLCKLNSRYLFAILSEENIGKVAIVDTKNIQCINIIEVSKYELTSISNFNDDSIIISCTENIDESYVVFIKQYQISKISGLKFVGQKTKKLCEYYIKPIEKGKKSNSNYDKLNYEYSKKIKEQINCITFTTGGLLICTGKIESPEISKTIGEIDLFV